MRTFVSFFSLCSLLTLAACAADPNAPAAAAADEPGAVLGYPSDVLDLSSRDDDAVLVEASVRDGLVYTAIRNESGHAWDYPKFAITVRDAGGAPIASADGDYHFSEEGGYRTPRGAVAHAITFLPELTDARGGPAPASVEVRLTSWEDYEMDEVSVKEVAFGDEGTEYGWVEATVCSYGFRPPGFDFKAYVIVLDAAGLPWDGQHTADGASDTDCAEVYVEGLEMPRDPRILVFPNM